MQNGARYTQNPHIQLDPHFQALKTNIKQRKHPQGRSAPLWGTAEGRAFAFFVKYDYSMPEYVDYV